MATSAVSPPPGPHWRSGVVQVAEPSGVTDLRPGHLDPALLPVDLLRAGYERAFDGYGPAALTYGENRGPEPLRELLAGRTGTDPDRILVTAGATSALAILSRLLAAPGDVVLAEPASYDYALALFRDHRLAVRHVAMDPTAMDPTAMDPAGMDPAGMDPAALAAAIDREQAAGRTVAFVYLIPTFQNPTGIVTGESRRRALAAAAADRGVRVVADDPYAELAFDPAGGPEAGPALAGGDGVVRLGSFSKILSPGLRLGWLVAEPALVGRLADGGTFASGGGLNHLAAVAVTGLLADGTLDRHLSWLRDQLRDRRDALRGPLADPDLPAAVNHPGGGFFLWLTTNRPATDLVDRAAAIRIPVQPGGRFGPAGAGAIRLSYSFHGPAALAAAAGRLAAAWRGSGRPVP